MGLILSTIIVIVVTILGVTLDFNQFTFQPGNLAFFIDFPSALLILLPAISLVAGASAGGDFWRGLKGAFSAKGAGEGAADDDAIAALVLFGHLSAYLGVFFFFVGAVLMLQNMTDPNQFGPATAVALIVLLYGLATHLWCTVAADRLRARRPV